MDSRSYFIREVLYYCSFFVLVFDDRIEKIREGNRETVNSHELGEALRKGVLGELFQR